MDTEEHRDEVAGAQSDGEPLFPRPGSGSRVGMAALLFIEMMEGVAFYTILPYVITFCRDDLELSKTQAVIIYLIFSGIVYMIPCASGAIGDSVLNRFVCTLISLTLFFIGSLVLLCLASFEVHHRVQVALYTASLVFMGLGYGATISTAYPFGIDQLADPTPRNMWSFFIWKHWFYSLGKFVSYLPLPYIFRQYKIQDELLPKAIVVMVAVGLSGMVLLFSQPWINIAKPQGRKTFRRLRNGLSRYLPCFCRESLEYVTGSVALTESCVRAMNRERRYCRLLLRHFILLVVVFSICGLFNVFRTQMTSTFFLQSHNLHYHDSRLPYISMSMLCPLVVILCVPLLEVYNRYKPHWQNLTNMDLMIGGHGFLALASVAAAVLETVVYDRLKPGQTDSGITPWAQGPQYILIGLADVICFIPGTEFTYKESPRHIEGFMSGMLYSAGSSLSLTIFIIETVIFRKFVSDDAVRQFRTHFLVLTCVSAGMLIFLIIPAAFIYRRFKHQHRDALDDGDRELFSTVHSYGSVDDVKA